MTDSDLLYGVKAIATYLQITEAQARPLIQDGTIPTFRMPGHTTRCARKSTLNSTWADYEKRWQQRHPGQPNSRADAA